MRLSDILKFLCKCCEVGERAPDEALLVEYQVLQQDSRSMVSTHWTVANIFIGINTALLGAVAYMLNNSNYSNNIQWTVLSLGVVLIVIFVCLWLWLNRVNKLVNCNESLMRDIERDLHIKVKEKPQGDGSGPIKVIYAAFIILWIANIAFALIFD